MTWDPGTGKTKTLVDYSQVLYAKLGRPLRVLIVAPINALGVWPDQIKRHSGPVSWRLIEPSGSISQKAEQTYHEMHLPDADITYLIVNYDSIIKRDKAWTIMSVLVEYSADLLILDECHKIKNPTSLRAKACFMLARYIPKVVAMTGTPIGKNLLDVYAQVKVIDPDIWKVDGKVMSWTAFKQRYGKWGGKSGFELRGYQNVEDLERRYLPQVSSVRKRECHDIPQVKHQIIPVELTPHQSQAYNIFAESSLLVWKRQLIEAPIVLTKLLRLQEMTGGWVHDENGKVVEFQTEKLRVLKDLVENLQDAGQKVVIYARFIAELEAIAKACQTDFVVRGGVRDRERRRLVEQWIRDTSDLSPFLFQIDSAEAIDGLQQASSYGIFYSTGHSLISYNQAVGRLERAGQTSPVTLYHLHVRGSVDTTTYRALRQKKDLERMVMDNPELLFASR